jgi:hypothetical protein
VKKLFMPYFLFSRCIVTHQFSWGCGVSGYFRFSKYQSAPPDVLPVFQSHTLERLPPWRRIVTPISCMASASPWLTP